MSGIAGIIRFDGAPIEPGLISKMTAAMAHRGPDAITHWEHRNASLGQCMLRTTPESLEETQPLTNEDGSLVLVMDGRVDNWQELRCELLGRGAVLRDRSDAELVLKTYEIWERECLSHIDGDFALVIWDARKQSAFCARDRMGVRPFYYTHQGSLFAFATDFHAIFELPGLARTINERMVFEHLTRDLASLTETLIDSVHRLPAAHCLSISKKQFDKYRYWDIDCFKQISYPAELDYVEHFLSLFQESVKRSMRSIGPIGVYLSGGVDSSSIQCVASQGLQQRSRLKSFSLTFPGMECDETEFIEAVNRHCAMSGNCLLYHSASVESYVQQVSKFRDICDSPTSMMTHPLRFLASQQGIRVMLTGYGADEWFGGNPFYYSHLIRSWDAKALIQQILYQAKAERSLTRALNSVLYRGIGPLVPERWHRPMRWLRKNKFGQSKLPDKKRDHLIHPNLASRFSLTDRHSANASCKRSVDPVHWYLHDILCNAWNVRGIELDNRSVSRFQLEERSPFYDRRLIEFAFGLPERLRSREMGKYVVREAMRGVLPDPIRERRDKADFSGVMAEFLLQPRVREMLECTELVAREWVDSAEVLRQYNNFFELYRNNSDRYIYYVWGLWAVFSLEAWVSESGVKFAHFS